MKKATLLAVCLAAFLMIFVSSAQAAGPLNIYVRGGIMSLSDFSFNPVYGLAGANIDFNLGALSISPECDIQLYQFGFKPVTIMSGAILNMNLAALYFGAGLMLPVYIGSGYTLKGDLQFKVNAGLKFGSLKLQIFILTPFTNFFQFPCWAGATLGAGF